MDADQIRIQLEVCEEDLDKLTEWETDFITSIHDQVARGQNLSPKQLDVLKRIYDKVA